MASVGGEGDSVGFAQGVIHDGYISTGGVEAVGGCSQLWCDVTGVIRPRVIFIACQWPCNWRNNEGRVEEEEKCIQLSVNQILLSAATSTSSQVLKYHPK